jgi:ABC-type nitrate/sulfonate/bicarbonate transport system permease component
MGMIIMSVLGLLFAAGVFYAARRILKKIEQGEES